MNEEERKLSEAEFEKGLGDMVKTLKMLSRVSPAWKKKVTRKIAEAFSEDEGESESEAKAARPVRTEDGMTKAFNAEIKPALQKRFGVTHQ